MRVIITGATGLLGRNLLFEIIKQNIDNLDKLEIFLLVRAKDNHLPRERIEEMISNDGIHYVGVTEQDIPKILKPIRQISYDLFKENLGISEDDFNTLRSQEIDYFFHIAALTDFRDSDDVKQILETVNFEGTKKITNLIDQLQVNEIIYVSSAYCCGKTAGKVSPDYVNLNESFRNPYERSKLMAEECFKDFAEKKGLRYRIFRPSTISGRLIEGPSGSVSKFDVFYSWAAFFLRYKIKQLKMLEDLYAAPFDMPIKIHINFNSGLNIVPVDYAAKMIYGVCVYNDPNKYYHLVNEEEISHRLYFSLLLDCLNIKNYEFVDDEIPKQNAIEKFYYKTVGRIFTPYITSKTISFDKSNLIEVEKKMNITCPPMNQQNFTKLIDYAKKYSFGIKTC